MLERPAALPRRQSLGLSRSTCLGQAWNDWQSQRTTLFADLTHHFNDDWKLKVSAVHSRNLQDIKYAASESTVDYGNPALRSPATPRCWITITRTTAWMPTLMVNSKRLACNMS